MASTQLQKLRKRAHKIAKFKNEDLDALLEIFYQDYIQDNFDDILSELSKVKNQRDVKGNETETEDKVSTPHETPHTTTENGEQ